MKRKCQDNSEARSFNSRWVGWNQTVRVQNYLTERVLISVYSEEPGMVRRRQCLGGGPWGNGKKHSAAESTLT